MNHFTDIGLRICMYMAQKQQHNAATTISELSERLCISRNHLVKVVQFLSNNKILAATRGRGGGLRLGDKAGSIRIGQLVQLLEQSSNLINCQSISCVLDGSCLLKLALDSAYQAFIEHLDHFSLQDVTAGKAGVLLQQLIQPSIAISVDPVDIQA